MITIIKRYTKSIIIISHFEKTDGQAFESRVKKDILVVGVRML